MKLQTVWLAEAPKFPGYYLRNKPSGDGVFKEKELGTYDPDAARKFETKAECEEYIKANPTLEWVPIEHMFEQHPTTKGNES